MTLAARESAEGEFLWNKGVFSVFDKGSIIGGAARDTGNTGATTTLLAGLILLRAVSITPAPTWCRPEIPSGKLPGACSPVPAPPFRP